MEGTKPCPDCAEDVQAEADVCRHCGHAFAGGRAWKKARNRRLLAVTLVTLAIAVGVWVLFVRSFERAERDACEDLQGRLRGPDAAEVIC